MMKKIILMIVGCLFVATCFAQTAKTLRGTVKEELNATPMSLVTIMVKDTLGEFVEGTSTDEKGHFKLQLPAGHYEMTYSFVGYASLSQPLLLKKDTILEIKLTDIALDVPEVVVQGERSSTTYLVDRKVIQVGKDLQSIGGDASEVLQQLAEVQTTAEGEVMLRGSNNVNILINGKPSPLSSAEVLRQIPAQEMVQIELITTPSAKYQADGLTGIINIITKKKTARGWTTAVNGRISNYEQINSGLQLSFGSASINAGLSANYSKLVNRTERNRVRIGGLFPYSQEGLSRFEGQVQSLKGHLDWFVDEKNELSFSLSHTNNSHDIPANVKGIEQDGQNQVRPFNFASLNTHEHLTTEYNANYRTYFSEKSNFLELDFHVSDNSNALPASFILNQDTSGNDIQYETRISNLSMDLEQSIPSLQVQLETGFLWTNKQVDNQQLFKSDLSAETSTLTSFQYLENTIAAYGLIKKNWEKWQVQLGLRWEDYQNEGTFKPSSLISSQSFQNFFPSFHLNYQHNEKLAIQLAYNRRISRPNLYQINPFTNSNDRFFQREGNPGLQPEFSQNLELTTRFVQDKWSFTPTLFLRAKSDLLVSAYILNEEDQRTFLQFINEGKSRAYGGEAALALFPFPFSRTTINANYYLERLSHLQNDFGSKKLHRFNITAKQLFNFGKRWRLDLSWFYWGDTQSRFSFYEARTKLDIAGSYKLFKNRATLSLRVTDIFNTLEYRSSFVGLDFVETSFRKSLSRVAYLSFSYRFEQGEKGKRRNRKSRSFDEPGSKE